jgi:hypothetical protein
MGQINSNDILLTHNIYPLGDFLLTLKFDALFCWEDL